MSAIEVDFSDVQGLVRFGYRHMTSASYALLSIRDANAAKSWIRAAKVTNAVAMNPVPTTALHVAFTAPGLKALQVPDAIIAEFSHEFRAGMAHESRSRQLGDVGENSPASWDWGGPGREPHLLVMFFGEPEHFETLVESSKGSGWNSAFEELRWLTTENLDGIEPFGFTDGISQPELDWEQVCKTPSTEIDYRNLAALGEFLLGYRNEYGKITDRPLLDTDATSAGLLLAEEAPQKRDLGRNGTYLVMRQLDQDVRKFWQFAYRQAEGDAAEADKLAAAMVGRTRAGAPLVQLQKNPIPGISADQASQNQFTFEGDPTGGRCPFGAHVRRANPRNSDFPNRPTGLARLITMLGFGPKGFRDDLMSSVRFHRILRRGREYGSGLKPTDALASAPPGDPSRGLHFICLNASISRQFEFLQNAWMASSKFSGLTEESDPLIGNRLPIADCPATNYFSMPKDDGLRQRISGLPRFVTVRGGAYFFLPSLRAIRYFAEIGSRSQ
jgi:Dyp-type peroxidase family